MTREIRKVSRLVEMIRTAPRITYS